MKGRIIGYDGERNELIIKLDFIPSDIPLNRDVEIK